MKDVVRKMRGHEEMNEGVEGSKNKFLPADFCNIYTHT